MIEDDETPLLCADGDGVRLLTLNRPHRRNALSPALFEQLESALIDSSFDDDIRAVVLTGSGSAFCAGLDMSTFLVPGADRTATLRIIRSIAAFPKPLIAAVNGPAVTGGLEIALNCDFIVAAAGATFRDTHLSVGVFPGGGMSARLPSAVGLRNAKMLSFTSVPITAKQGLDLGLVSVLTGDDDVVATAVAMATVIAERDPVLIREMKEAYDSHARATLSAGLEAELTINTRRRWMTKVADQLRATGGVAD